MLAEGELLNSIICMRGHMRSVWTNSQIAFQCKLTLWDARIAFTRMVCVRYRMPRSGMVPFFSVYGYRATNWRRFTIHHALQQSMLNADFKRAPRAIMMMEKVFSFNAIRYKYIYGIPGIWFPYTLSGWAVCDVCVLCWLLCAQTQPSNTSMANVWLTNICILKSDSL